MKKIYFLLVALLFTLSTGAQTLRGDVNGDGIVNIGDVTDLVNIILYGDEDEDEDEPDTPIVPGGYTHIYVDLGLSVKWAECNIGASCPEDFGYYYAWGETKEKNYYSWDFYKYCNGTENSLTKYSISSSYGTEDNKTTLEPEDDVAHVEWGGSWRMPTIDEINELREKCIWEWTTINGIGYRVTGPNGNSIFLPAAGEAENDYQGAYGLYWSSSLSNGDSNNAFYLFFDSSNNDNGRRNRYHGHPVRPVCE